MYRHISRARALLNNTVFWSCDLLCVAHKGGVHGCAMARQLCALGRALSAVRLSAPGCVARAGTPLGLGSMRAFSAAGEDPPTDGTSFRLRQHAQP